MIRLQLFESFKSFSGFLLIVICSLHRSFAFNCITWDVVHDELHFIYRTDDLLNSVSLKDYDGNVKITCNFEQQEHHCYPISTFKVIFPNKNRKEIVFRIHDFDSKDVDGTWSVLQGGRTFSTFVSLSNGFIQSTDIYMTGKIDLSKVTVGCYSCRPPHGYNVEFLVNGISEDSLTLDYKTGKCTHQIGECKPDVCSCNPSGNEFFRSFYLQDANKTANFSCDMIFVDVVADSMFSKYATLFYDGKEIHSKETKTVIEYSSGKNNGNTDKTKDNNETECVGTLIGIVLTVVILFIHLVAWMVFDKKSRTRNIKTNNELSSQMINQDEEYFIRNKNIELTSEDELSSQMINQDEEYFIRNKNIEQTSEEELSFQMNNQVEEYSIGNKRTHVGKSVQTPQEKQNVDHFKSKQRPNSFARPFDVVFINFDVVVERKWVERVVEMLEEQYDLVCGLINREFMIGLQTDDSFNFIEKHTPVVVTFSEKSCKGQHPIRFIKNIDKLVAVMVEDCSPLIFNKNMKCVDATLDEEQWLKQLFTALNIKRNEETYVSVLSDQ